MPFEAKLDENNRWIVLSQVIIADDAVSHNKRTSAGQVVR